MPPKHFTHDLKEVNDAALTNQIAEYFNVGVRTIQCYLNVSKGRDPQNAIWIRDAKYNHIFPKIDGPSKSTVVEILDNKSTYGGSKETVITVRYRLLQAALRARRQELKLSFQTRTEQLQCSSQKHVECIQQE